MAGITYRHLLLAASLLVVATLGTAQEPPRICIDTGPSCIDDCVGQTSEVHQWCGGCKTFISCNGEIIYYQSCPNDTYFSDDVDACLSVSNTCEECVIYAFSTTAPTYCTSSPCAFGGTCIQEPGGGYYCICAPGYAGQNCSTVTNFCDSDPCLNGGTCHPQVDGYVCQCAPGYTGGNCQNVINNCASLPCMNGGTCQNGINIYVCICPPEWTGPRCNLLLDPCSSAPCANGGTCVNNCGVAQCICPPGWTGTSCNTYVDHCASNPCQNGGSCQNVWNGWVCICPPSFTGLFCEQIIDLCASRPCQNGGTCAFDCGIYQCFCPEGWTGYNCQTPISACDPNLCQNGATCTDLGGDEYTCICPPNWTGVNCESPNYNETLTCGSTLTWSQYNASNGFTRLCYFWAPPDDSDGRATQCRYTIQGIPLYNDYTGLLTAGGNFGCLVSQNYPDDLPATSAISCADNYQQDVTLGSYNESARLMVCLRYPYDGVPRIKYN